MNKKGYVMTELMVSMGFIFAVMLAIFNVSLYISNLLNKEIKEKTANEEIAIIYKNIATKFSTKNISSIKYESGKYQIQYLKSTVFSKTESTIITNSTIFLSAGTLSIDNQKFSSTKYLKYTGLTVKKYKSSSNNKYYFLVLTINYKMLNEEKSFSIYYVNEPPNDITNISEVSYE